MHSRIVPRIPPKGWATRRIKDYSLLLPAFLMYALLAHHLNFVQDDAFITFRYAANFLEGHGLVFNIGERVEGYTNFGWLIYLILWGRLGFEIAAVAKITGFILGAATIFLYFLIARRLLSDEPGWVSVAVVYLMAANQSLAYWSPAGLETAAFSFCVAAALYLFLISNRLLTVALIWATLLRPEGILIGASLVVIEIVHTRRWFVFSLKCVLTAVAMLLPYWVFKMTYYGSLLPNSFYAKTGFDVTQVWNGLEYAGTFFLHYGFFGIGFLVPLILRRRCAARMTVLISLAAIYTLYIVLIGGDVLKVHRFFIPILGVVAILSVRAVALLTRPLRPQLRHVLLPVVLLGMVAYTLLVPNEYVATYNQREKGFIHKMKDQAAALKAADSSRFSVALSTIGVFGYELLEHRIIDMLGLTDSTIARHPQTPIAGITSTWKEGKYNSDYLLQRAPDYVLFSTGVKPSAPAERALCLYPQFLNSYRTLSWYREPIEPGIGGTIDIFKRVRPVTGTIEPVYSPQYVEDYNRGLNATDVGTALAFYLKALATDPSPPNMNLMFARAEAHIRLGQVAIGRQLLNAMLEYDSLIFEAHKQLYLIETIDGNKDKARIHRRWLLQLVPWDVPRIDSLVQAAVDRRSRRNSRQ